MITRFFCFAAACLGFTSCLSGSTSTCSATQIEPVGSASGPKTIALNQTATYTLTYVSQNACGKFDSFLEQSGTAANSYTVGLRVNYTGCNCPTTTVPAQTTYSFKPTQAGTYYLNFVANTTSGFVTDTLVVQ